MAQANFNLTDPLIRTFMRALGARQVRHPDAEAEQEVIDILSVYPAMQTLVQEVAKLDFAHSYILYEHYAGREQYSMRG